MKLYFIRHGETDWNLLGKIQGSHDIPLNETGLRQAEELSRRLIEQGYRFTKIYTSQQQRAFKTAEILSQYVNMEVTPVKGLEEVNLGDWEGLSWSEVKLKFPEEYNAWYHNRRYARAPRGESYQDLLDRLLPAIHTILQTNSDHVAIVTHGAVVMSLQCYLTDTPFQEMKKFAPENTAVVEIDSGMFVQEGHRAL